MSLYSIAAEYERFFSMIEAGEIPEEAIADTLDSIEGEFREKLENTISVIKNKRAEIEAIKEEVKALTERLKAKTKDAERLIGYVALVFERTGKEKYESARHKVSFRKSEALEIADEEALINFLEAKGYDALLKYEMPTVNKTEVKAAIARGESFPGAEIVKKLNIQIK